MSEWLISHPLNKLLCLVFNLIVYILRKNSTK